MQHGMRMAGFGLVLLLGPVLAQGQDTQPESNLEPVHDTTVAVESLPPPPPTVGGLDEIIVTAQRRAASVQQTPISMVALGSDQLEQRGIRGVEDLSGNVPGMVIEPHPLSSTTLRITLRGVGITDAQVTQDPAVGIYLDGVYLARSSGLALELADLERIEVLRGPQGTLYGRNTTGGAVNLVSRRPSTEGFSMAHQLSLGSRDLASGKSTFNLPLGETLAAKVALLGSQRGGFVENTGPGGNFGDREEQAGRFDLRWQPIFGLTADYSADYTDLTYFDPYFQAVLPPRANKGLAEFFKHFAEEESVYSDRRLSRLSSGPNYEPGRSRVRGHSLTLTLPTAFDTELKYIGAYRHLTDNQYADLGGGGGSLRYRVDTNAYTGPAGLLAGGPQGTPLVIPRIEQSQLSHELQLSGTALQRVEFIFGAYAFREWGGEDGGPTHHIFSATLDPAQLDPLLSLLPQQLRGLLRDAAFPSLAAFWDYDIRIRNEAYALFAHLTWTPDVLDDRLRLTGGLRQSWDRREALKNFIQTQYIEARLLGVGLAAVPVPGSIIGGVDDFVDVHAMRRDSQLTPSANLQFDITPRATTYLSYATAFKSGGFNTRDPQVSAASSTASDGTDYGFGFVEGFRPERVRSLEVGLKSQWMGGRLRSNLALFDTRFRDMQTNFLLAGSIADTKARNAGRSQIKGAELELGFVLLEGLILGGQYTYLDAVVQEVLDVNGNNVADLYPFIAAPPKSYVATLDWTLLRRDWGDLRAYVDYRYTGERTGFVITEEKRGLTTQKGYGVLNARLTAGNFRVGRGMLDIAVWGRNLRDTEYELTAVDNFPHADRAVLWGEPRAFGMDLIYRYP